MFYAYHCEGCYYVVLCCIVAVLVEVEIIVDAAEVPFNWIARV